jgi:hypothetical protein
MPYVKFPTATVWSGPGRRLDTRLNNCRGRTGRKIGADLHKEGWLYGRDVICVSKISRGNGTETEEADQRPMKFSQTNAIEGGEGEEPNIICIAVVREPRAGRSLREKSKKTIDRQGIGVERKMRVGSNETKEGDFKVDSDNGRSHARVLMHAMLCVCVCVCVRRRAREERKVEMGTKSLLFRCSGLRTPLP